MKRNVLVLAGVLAGLASPPALAGGPGAAPGRVDFDRHVVSLFGRLGCNAGACHGSFQGRGGLNLSLFGHDPARDYQALTRDALGRRVDVLDPDRSLLLLKPTGRVPHEGGLRFSPDSWEYRVIRDWVAGGATRDPSRPSAERVEIRPSSVALKAPGDSARFAVFARYADGSEDDVTPFCDVRARDDAVARVSPGGEVRGVRPGDTSVVASYRGLLASSRVMVPTGRRVETPGVPAADLIDREVYAKLKALGIEPSGPASDAEFYRRVTLDVIGTLPTPEAVRAFLDDPAADKRSRAIDALLADPAHAALWATRWLDVTGCDVEAMEGPAGLRKARARMWHDWFRRRFADNVPYDRIARGVLCATSRDGADAETWVESEQARLKAARAGGETGYADKPGLDLYWRRFADGESEPIETTAERAAAAFLGVRIECAQCHKHPFDRWTQDDYRGFANVFAGVKLGLSPEGRAAGTRALERLRKASPDGSLPPTAPVREVYVEAGHGRSLRDPSTGQPRPPKALGGPEFPREGDPREALFAWLARPDNPYFARTLVNRVWAAYFGAGLVDPVDGFSVANPPSNPSLLDALADDFARSGYDVRRLERRVLRSRAYQRSSSPASGNLDDRGGNFARSAPRTLPAEVLVDALNAALGVPGDFGDDAPKGARAIEVATNRVASPDLARVLRIFGRPERTSTCDCQRPREPAVPQTLFLMSDPGLLDKLARGRLANLLGSGRCDGEVVDELFLATLSRFPGPGELGHALDHFQRKPDRKAAATDLLWALINTREFVLNH